ncbi:hypothetical protein N0V93_008143 [Gnomoniopsis smithogilvyi]|uniref:2-oxoadipate dioxygenase/decarboxylase n=1 Tax=Gnomoniopsis smithogilvyi TaxID=1191159 RepID=A0A9W8YNK2_9PEZI|nr:hypothetical protein N0V93_008143 [Gnomoniopsis smithogilvyi]
MSSASILSASHTAPPKAPAPGDWDYVDADSLRTTFALAMSAMYSTEVPLYSDLIRIVQNVNRQVLAQASSSSSSSSSPSSSSSSPGEAPVHDSVERLTLERHGAIRLGTPQELHTVRRIFALMGMHPVGYYDLTVAKLPMHATCFRPIAAASLEANPFRVFTTLLRPERLHSSEAREVALRLLARRNIFSRALLDLLDTAEARQQGRLTREQGDTFVAEALRSFSWQPVAAATHEEYGILRAEHPILADIACFRSAHINHLTPRALDIDMAQRSMIAEAIHVKERIEGPPRRNCPILLRQTSFLALEEGIRFPSREDGGGDDDLVDGHHKARFGEIEERGAAVTAKGRKLYDELLEEAASRAVSEEEYAKLFARFPDSWDELRRQKLIYCEYQCESDAREKLAGLDVSGKACATLLDVLVQQGILTARPLTYEDFLPFSAAGIFQSNLQSKKPATTAADPATPSVEVVVGKAGGDREGYERAMQCSALDSDQLYAEAQRRSLEKCAGELGLDVDIVADLI